MPKLALFLLTFFLLILFQQSSYGFIEGAEVPTLSNFPIERTSDIILIDLPHQENPAKRYLVYGSGSLNSAYHDSKNIEEASLQVNSLLFPIMGAIAVILALQISIIARRR